MQSIPNKVIAFSKIQNRTYNQSFTLGCVVIMRFRFLQMNMIGWLFFILLLFYFRCSCMFSCFCRIFFVKKKTLIIYSIESI